MQSTKLTVLRGPSGSGKSSVAKAIREKAQKPIAIVEQDYLRRTVLKEKDVEGGLNIELIQRTTLFLLENSYDVILEGIFDKGRYEKMFEAMIERHPNDNYFFYFDISLEETLRRHQFKANRSEFGEKEMRRWHKKDDFLECVQEQIIAEYLSLTESVQLISTVSNRVTVKSFL